MKVYDFIIELKRPNYLLVDLVSRLMLLFSISSLGYTIYASIQTSVVSWYTYFLGVLILGQILWWMRCYLITKKGNIAYYRIGLLLATIGWGSLTRFSWITILYFIAVLIEKQVKFPQEIAFDTDGIVFNTLPKKSYQWQEMTNIILKDGILTLDFKNNKLIQKPIDLHTTEMIEKEFNEFCKDQLLHKNVTSSQFPVTGNL